MRDVSAIRAYVRSFMFLEPEDMDDALIDAWILEGYRRIVRITHRWPHFESEWTIQNIDSAQNIEMPADLEEIGQIMGPWGPLAHMGESAARDDFTQYGTSTTETGQPQAWSRHGTTLRVWPIPDQEYSMQVIGWRKPLRWHEGGAGATPDMPEDLEDALLSWVMHRAYLHQDDIEHGTVELTKYQAAVDEMVSYHNAGDLGGPLVMGGGRRRRAGFVGERPHPTWGYVR